MNSRHRAAMIAGLGSLLLLCGWLISATVALKPLPALAQAGLPPAVAEKLAALALAFESVSVGYQGSEAFPMHQRVEATRTGVADVLSYARQSDANAAGLAAELERPLAAYAQRFAPGLALTPEDLERRAWVIGQQPTHGFALKAYLLTRVMDIRRSSVFSGRSLRCLCELVDAENYRAGEGFKRRHPELRTQIEEREARGDPRFISQLGSQVAWVMEQHILALHGSRPDYLGAEALPELDAYAVWHQELVRSGRGDQFGLASHCANDTTRRARKLADLLDPPR